MIFVDRAGNEYTFKMPVVFDVESPLRVVNEIASNTTVPQNGRVARRIWQCVWMMIVLFK